MTSALSPRAPVATAELAPLTLALSPNALVTVDNPSVPALQPQRARAAELCKLAADLDRQMWKSVRGKGIGDVQRIASRVNPTSAAWLVGLGAAVTGACLGFDPSGPTAGFFLGMVGGGVGGALGGAGITATGWSAYYNAASGKLGIEAARPFIDAYATGDADARQLVAALASQWLKRLDLRKTSGEAVRIELQNIVASEANAGNEHGTLGADVAHILGCLRGPYGEPLKTITESDASKLRSRITRIDPEMRAEVGVLLDTIMPRIR